MTIWKFILAGAVNDVEMPNGARVIEVHEQHGQICVWAWVDPAARRVTRRLVVVGTGHAAPENELEAAYVGSAHLQGGAFVFHVFDEGLAPASREQEAPGA